MIVYGYQILQRKIMLVTIYVRNPIKLSDLRIDEGNRHYKSQSDDQASWSQNVAFHA